MGKENANNNNYIELHLSDFWKVFKRCWWLLMAVVILVTGVVYLYMERSHVDQYQSSATLYVLRTDGRSQLVYQDAAFATAIIDDCKELILSEENVIVPAIKKLSSAEYTDAELKDRVALIKRMVSVKSASGDSRILYITATSGTAEGATKVANAMALASTEYLNNLFGQNLVNLTEAAKVPKNISNPVSVTKAGLFGVAAAALIYLIWFIVFILDDRIDSEANVERFLGLTVLGAIPYWDQSKRRGRNRYGSYRGYYGYGYGYAAQQQSQDASSDSDKEAKQ